MVSADAFPRLSVTQEVHEDLDEDKLLFLSCSPLQRQLKLFDGNLENPNFRNALSFSLFIL
jgi:hypothetical protein